MRIPKPYRSRKLAQSSGLLALKSARGAVLAIWLVVTVVAACVAITGFRIDNSVGVWFAADDPALIDYRQSLADFGNREWMLVAFEREPASPEAQSRDRDLLVAQFEQLEHVHWVLSLSDFPIESELARKFLKPDPHSPHEAVLLQITNDIDRQDGYREALVSQLRQVAQGLTTITSVRVAGTAVINGELNRAARRDMFMFFPAVAVFVAILGWVIFRNVRDVAVLLCVSLGTVIVTEGLLIAAGYRLNMVTIMLPTVLIALSVADAVHLIHAFHESRLQVGKSVQAASNAVKLIARPCAGTTLTTIAGFLAFSGSSVLPVFQLAVFASFGIALAWVLTMTGAPLLLVVLWQRTRRVDPPVAQIGRRLLGNWSRFVTRHPRRIVAAFALTSVALIGLPSLQADTDYVKFFRSDSRVPLDYDRLQRMGFPQNPLSLVFALPADRDPLSEQYWIPLDSFVRRLDALPGVHSVMSPFVMSGSLEVLGNHRETFGGMFSSRTNQVQLVVMMDYPSSQRLFRLLTEIRELAQQVLPADMTLIPTGTSYLWARMDDGVIETQKESLAIVCVTCFVILVFLFRSVRLGLLGLALSLYPVAMVLGLMGLLHIPVNLATVLIAGIAVGLAVDDTIHYVHAFQESRRQGNDRRLASEQAIAGVGLRMVVTSLILVGSFASMGFSNFMPTSQFGLLSSLTIGLALAADLALLPALLSRRRASVVQSFASCELPTTVGTEPAASGRSAWARMT